MAFFKNLYCINKIIYHSPHTHSQDLPPGYGYFAFRDSDDEPIIKCLMENITNEQVVFIHRLDPTFELSYNQALKITDGKHILKPWPVSVGHGYFFLP